MPSADSTLDTLADAALIRSTQRRYDGFFDALRKGWASLLRGMEDAADPTSQEVKPYDTLGADVFPRADALVGRDLAHSTARRDPALTATAVQSYLVRPEMTFGEIAGRTKLVPTKETFYHAYSRRHNI